MPGRMKPPSRASSGGSSARLRSELLGQRSRVGASRPGVPRSAGSPRRSARAAALRLREPCADGQQVARAAAPEGQSPRARAEIRAAAQCRRRTSSRGPASTTSARPASSRAGSRRARSAAPPAARPAAGRRHWSPSGRSPPAGEPWRSPARLRGSSRLRRVAGVDQHHAAGLDRRGRGRGAAAAPSGSARDSRAARRRRRAPRARTLPKPVQRRDLEGLAQPPLGGDAVEARVGQRRDRSRSRARARPASSSSSRCGTRISPAPRRASAAGSAPRATGSVANAPVEMSTRARPSSPRRWPPRRPDSCCGRASSRPSSVSVPGVTMRTTSRRTSVLPPRRRASAGSSSCSQIATLKPLRISRCR